MQAGDGKTDGFNDHYLHENPMGIRLQKASEAETVDLRSGLKIYRRGGGDGTFVATRSHNRRRREPGTQERGALAPLPRRINGLNLRNKLGGFVGLPGIGGKRSQLIGSLGTKRLCDAQIGDELLQCDFTISSFAGLDKRIGNAKPGTLTKGRFAKRIASLDVTSLSVGIVTGRISIVRKAELGDTSQGMSRMIGNERFQLGVSRGGSVGSINGFFALRGKDVVTALGDYRQNHDNQSDYDALGMLRPENGETVFQARGEIVLINRHEVAVITGGRRSGVVGRGRRHGLGVGKLSPKQIGRMA